MPTKNNNSNANDADDGKDGIFDRLARTLFANPNSPFTEFADRQRIERLEQCQELQHILEACQENNDTKKNKTRTIGISDIPTSRSGTRIARFFKWDTSDMSEETDAPQQTDSSGASDVFNEAASSFTTDNDNSQPIQSKKSDARRTSFSKGCTIETHELWACKALAVGCGNHLQDLRRCWSNQNNSIAVRDNGGMTYYKSDKEKSCSSIQVDMARCINKHIAELNERSNNAAKKQ